MNSIEDMNAAQRKRMFRAYVYREMVELVAAMEVEDEDMDRFNLTVDQVRDVLESVQNRLDDMAYECGRPGDPEVWL